MRGNQAGLASSRPEQRRTANASAKVRRPVPPPTRRNRESASFGMMPASSVSARSLSAADTSQRTNVAREILETEQLYVRHMQDLVTYYRTPLLQMAKTAFEGLIPDIKDMFGNIHMIIQVNEDLVTRLSDRMDKWSSTTLIGDILLSIVPYLKLYIEYGTNYQKALQTYNRLLDQISFANMLEIQRANTLNNLSLDFLLIMPVQRIPRYNLLITELLKCTESDHPDYQNLKNALELTKEVTEKMNETIRKTENLGKLAAASSKGTGFKGLVEAHRRLINEVKVPCQIDGKREKIHLYLFNDIIVWATKADIKKQTDISSLSSQVPIRLTWVKMRKGSGVDIIGPRLAITLLSDDKSRANVHKFLMDFNKLLKELLTEPCEHGTMDEHLRYGAWDFTLGPNAPTVYYEGWWKHGKKHGKGVFTVGSSVYKGSFENDVRKGRGELIYASGDRYVGEWESNCRHGPGKVFFMDGSVFTGHFSRGHREGKGTLVYASGDKYTGLFNNDLPHGEGELRLISGFRYDGSFSAGLFHGKGTVTWPSGTTYTGDWKHGIREGSGVLKCADGSSYKGEWKGNRRHGQGTQSYVDGYEYEYVGHWTDNVRHGQGKLTNIDGSNYQGGFKSGVVHGHGTYQYATGAVYVGVWKNGKREGRGSLLYGGGQLEVAGRFSVGVLEGKATLKQFDKEGKEVQSFSASTVPDGFSIESKYGDVFLDGPPELAPIYGLSDKFSFE